MPEGTKPATPWLVAPSIALRDVPRQSTGLSALRASLRARSAGGCRQANRLVQPPAAHSSLSCQKKSMQKKRAFLGRICFLGSTSALPRDGIRPCGRRPDSCYRAGAAPSRWIGGPSIRIEAVASVLTVLRPATLFIHKNRDDCLWWISSENNIEEAKTN